MYDSILVPVDGSDESMAAVEEAAAFAADQAATLHVLYVVDTSVATPDGPPDVLEQLQELGERAIERARAVATDADVETVTAEVMAGSPIEEILGYVDTQDVELVVMGTHGRSGLDRLLLGSVTEKVVRASPVPVLTVRTFVDDD